MNVSKIVDDVYTFKGHNVVTVYQVLGIKSGMTNMGQKNENC